MCTRTLAFQTLMLLMIASSCKSRSLNEDTNASRVAIVGGELVADSVHPAAKFIAAATVKIKLPVEGTCTGTLISRRLVLTAAHCAQDTFNDYQIEFSHSNLAKGTVKGLISNGNNNLENIIKHAGYVLGNEGTINDIAILRLDSDAPAGSVPAHLLTVDAPLKPVNHNTKQVLSRGQSIIVAGHGRDKTGGNLAFKMSELELYTLDSQTGNLNYSSEDSAACKGDSGGPNFVFENGKLILIGITSMATCDREGEIVVNEKLLSVKYFNVVGMDIRKFQGWIRSKITLDEMKEIKLSPVSFTPATSKRPDTIVIGVINSLEGNN